MKYRGPRAGSATGSSRYQTTSGIDSANSSGVTTLVMCSTPMAAADSAATSISEKPSRSNPVVNVSSFGLYRLASAAMRSGDALGDVLHPDGGRGLGGDVDLGEALALEPGGERQQLRVVPLGQRGDAIW